MLGFMGFVRMNLQPKLDSPFSSSQVAPGSLSTAAGGPCAVLPPSVVGECSLDPPASLHKKDVKVISRKVAIVTGSSLVEIHRDDPEAGLVEIPEQPRRTGGMVW